MSNCTCCALTALSLEARSESIATLARLRQPVVNLLTQGCPYLSPPQRFHAYSYGESGAIDDLPTARERGQSALAALRQAADRLVRGHGDRLLRDLRQRHARHA